tara:strand:+ start:114 stop:305 length:192 start_codon:yes stop_codon:yes gene_type:complete
MFNSGDYHIKKYEPEENKEKNYIEKKRRKPSFNKKKLEILKNKDPLVGIFGKDYIIYKRSNNV